MSLNPLGTLRWYQEMGQPYADLLNNALKPAIGSVAVTKYLGASVAWSLGVGVGVVLGMLAVAVGMGWLVARYRIVHAQREQDWKANPAMCRQIELLEEIARATAEPKIIVV